MPPARIIAAVAADRAALAVTAGWGKPTLPQVRSVPLGRDGRDAVAASPDSLISRRYPLARSVHAYFNRAPSRPLDVRIERFLRYLLSDPGDSGKSLIRATICR